MSDNSIWLATTGGNCVVYEKLQILADKDYSTIPYNALAILQHFYGALTALDITSAAILTFNAILVAAAINSARDDEIKSVPFAHFLARAVTVVALVSAGFALLVDRVSYPFWGYVGKIEPHTLDFTVEFKKLGGEIAQRTLLYRAAWYLSLFAIFLFLLCIFWPWLRTTRLGQKVSTFWNCLQRLCAKSSATPKSQAADPGASRPRA